MSGPAATGIPTSATPGQWRFRRFTRPMLLGFVLSAVGVLGALTVLPG